MLSKKGKRQVTNVKEVDNEGGAPLTLIIIKVKYFYKFNFLYIIKIYNIFYFQLL